MRQCTVGDIYGMIDALAPFETAMAFDNVGLLVGAMERPVTAVLTALDATPGVIAEAQALGAELLVTHHPLLFTPIQRLDEAVPEAALLCGMIRAGVSMIAAHTNLDQAAGGVNDVLVERLGWPRDGAEAFLRYGSWPVPRTLGELEAEAAQRLGAQVIRYGAEGLKVTRYAVCSGSGGSEVAGAQALGADVLLTGEIKHDKALEAMQRGVAVLACGHRATEICAADLLAKHLQSRINEVELKVRVFVSQIDPFV